MLGPFALKEDIRKFLWFLHKPWKIFYTLNGSEIFNIGIFFRVSIFFSFLKNYFNEIIKLWILSRILGEILFGKKRERTSESGTIF